MKQMTTNELRKVQLDMLNYIDHVCRDNQIEYSLGGGSLLGSIRHKGFIPWDDDIDIMLTRNNYEKLIIALKSEDNEQYQLLHYTTERNLLPFAKLYDNRTMFESITDKMHPWTGVFIDLFPMDHLPDNQNERKKFFREIHNQTENLLSTSFPAFISGSRKLYSFARFFLRGPRFLIYHGKSKELAQKTDRTMQKYNNKGTDYVGFTDSRYRLREYFPSYIFDTYEDVAFEKLVVRKIKHHEVYLEQLYGKHYMDLPPKNKRVNHDYYNWYWKEGEV